MPRKKVSSLQSHLHRHNKPNSFHMIIHSDSGFWGLSNEDQGKGLAAPPSGSRALLTRGEKVFSTAS